VLSMAKEFRKTDRHTPLVLMGYANPIEAMGVQAFVEGAVSAEVDGVIVVDYPPEECEAMAKLLQAKQMNLIFLIAPTTTDERISEIASHASGYVYYVSLRGVTGAGHLDTAEVGRKVKTIRDRTKLPIGVGFGISDGATARAIADVADAVIIGSRVIQEIEAAPEDAPRRVKALLASIRGAMDAR
jgi:tryptophan synthase alpha chain